MKRACVIAAVCIVLGQAAIIGQSLEARLQRAIQTETVTGDLKAAIIQYQQIVADAGANRAIAARALLRMADCHRKLGNADAGRILEQVAREFTDQPDAVSEARAQLTALRERTGAARSTTVRKVWSGPEVDALGAPSADGRVLSYTNWDTGDLGLRDLSTGRNRLLTNTGGWEASGDFAEFSVPSPDGREVAYAWFNDKGTPAAPYELRVIATTGQNPRPRVLHKLGAARWVYPGCWTPDGKSVVFVRELPTRQLELAIVDVATAAVRVLTPVTSALQRISVSPDGRHVAFDQAPENMPMSRDLFVMRIEGSDPLRVAPGPANDQMPLWSPDGSRLVFLSSRTGSNGLWSIAMRDGQPAGDPELVKPDVGAFYPLAITTTGTLYYFEGGARDNVYQVALDEQGRTTGAAPALISDRYINANASAAWSPDGRHIAYYAFPARDVGGASLIVRDTRDQSERMIPTTADVPRAWSMLRWFPGSDAVLVCGRMDNRDTTFLRVDIPSGRQEEVLRVPSRPSTSCASALSPDGRILYYLHQDVPNGIHELRRFELATRRSSTLLQGWITSLALSPDGRHLAMIFTAEGQNGRTRELAILPATGGARRAVHTASWYDTSRWHSIGWSAAGDRIFFARPDGDGTRQVLWSIPAADGEPTAVGIAVNGRIKLPEQSRDGRSLLYTVREFHANSIWTLENFLPARAARGQ